MIVSFISSVHSFRPAVQGAVAGAGGCAMGSIKVPHMVVELFDMLQSLHAEPGLQVQGRAADREWQGSSPQAERSPAAAARRIACRCRPRRLDKAAEVERSVAVFARYSISTSGGGGVADEA